MLRTIFTILGIVFAVALLYVGFTNRGKFFSGSKEKSVPLNVDLREIKPSGWDPVEKDGLLQIDIDKDDAVEWLFLYFNTNDTGQIGAVVYDAQNSPRGDSSIAVPQQSPAYLIPYPLMPDYTSAKNRGYLGDESIQYEGVNDGDAEKKTGGENADAIQGNRLQLRGLYRGRTNRFSAFWWVDEKIGYNGALAYTPGWFSLSPDNPNAWDAWDERKVISNLWAWEPQVDRSNICRRALWKLEDGPNPPLTRQFTAFYDAGDLVFCKGSQPVEPAFPEAQVLAYLQDQKEGRWKKGVPPETFSNVSVFYISEPEITDQPPSRPAAQVSVDFVSNDVQHRMVWLVELQPSTNVKEAVHWRIISATER